MCCGARVECSMVQYRIGKVWQCDVTHWYRKAILRDAVVLHSTVPPSNGKLRCCQAILCEGSVWRCKAMVLYDPVMQCKGMAR